MKTSNFADAQKAFVIKQSEEGTPGTEPILQGARAFSRGVCRMLHRHDIFAVPEVPLRNGRRVDLMGLSKKGDVIIVEIKCARGDLMGDTKWTEYLDYCDRFYWAVPSELHCQELYQERFLPERCGLIVADAYDAEIARPAALHALAASRRKVETLRIARHSMRRLLTLADPALALDIPAALTGNIVT
ncbi:MmcB family DNA repair protein [Sphingobium sp. DEHP117]|uniref:MmcB family DNA repair protein n=1 Tax=Sphingobium sp. DEHP117 TaxID=2993436 RepID=UPI0027D743B8|nr:MmcB family DNA repair protein [Sphingobium sp. DEHP117]MDQ4420394.1 MmcB family DNA repair protein [Sphingobium sp. DEHP117]